MYQIHTSRANEKPKAGISLAKLTNCAKLPGGCKLTTSRVSAKAKTPSLNASRRLPSAPRALNWGFWAWALCFSGAAIVISTWGLGLLHIKYKHCAHNALGPVFKHLLGWGPGLPVQVCYGALACMPYIWPYMEIIPAIDVIDGKCVRLTQGDYAQQKTYNNDPVAVAKDFEQAGVKRLHLVDLDGAKAQHVVNLAVLENIASQTQLHIDFGGGVKSDQDLEAVLNAGARQVTGGSIAVKNPAVFEKWLATHGAEKIILGADVRQEMVAVSGWQEASSLSIWQLLDQYVAKGIQYVICTDISKDGLLQGTANALYSRILQAHPNLKLIASGGVSHVNDLHALQALGVHGVIIGKALYEGAITLPQLRTFLTT